MRVITGIALLAGLACMAGPAVGGSPGSPTTSTFAVNLTIQAQCVINSTNLLQFGTAGVLGGALGTTNTDAQANFFVQCTNTTPFTIGLDAGTTSNATTTARLLTSGTATIGYALYSDGGRSVNWGNATGSWVSSTGTGASQQFTVYGRVPPQNTPAPGLYTDTITVTVSY